MSRPRRTRDLERGARNRRGDGGGPGGAGPAQGTTASPGRRCGLILFILALLVRLIYVLESSAGPSFAVPVVDSADYDLLARSLLGQGEPLTSLFWQPVFYPLFLTGVYALTGSSIALAKVLQAVLGAVTCVLAYRLGMRLFDRRTGVVAGLITAFYGPLIFFEGELLATGWAALWCVLLVLLFVNAADPQRRWMALVLGVCGALSVVTRPTFLPPFVAGCVWLLMVWWRRRRDAGRTIGSAAVVLVGFLAVALPVGALRDHLYSHFGIMPASGGINFYIGNNPSAEVTVSYRPGQDWGDLLALPEQHGVTGDVWARQRFFYRQAMDYAADDPLGFAGGLGRKTLQIVNTREMPRSLDVYVFRPWSHLLSALCWRAGGFGFPFGVLLPLAVIGLVHHGRRVPVPVWLLLILYPAAVVLVFVAGRYRAPLVPVMAVPAAAGCLVLIAAVRTRNARRVLAGAAIAAAVVLAGTLPGPFLEERTNYAAELHQLVGNRLMAEDRLNESIAQYRLALERGSEQPAVHAKLAEALLRSQDYGGAIEHYRAALARRPDHAMNRFCLGLAYEAGGRLDEALEQYRQTVRLDPTLGKAWSNLGVVCQKTDRLDQAIDAYRQAARAEPGEAIIHYNLGAALAVRGDLDDAVAALRHSLRINPAQPAVRHELALALRRLGRNEEAMLELQRALRIDPSYAPARRALAEMQGAGR